MSGELLTVAQGYAADKAAIAAGVAGTELMENAGRAVADAICLRWGIRPASVLCGPGSNGGDGFVAARILADRGWPVTVFLLGDRSGLRGDAAHHAALWKGDVLPIAEIARPCGPLIVDALFGAGLSRPIDGEARGALRSIPPGTAVVAVDVPSGVDGDTGKILGHAQPADVTVTFLRAKPAHFLMPGKGLAGELVIADIGIPDAVLDTIQPATWLNGPDIWHRYQPHLRVDGHKYGRGHLGIVGGGEMTGAARLAARAALRSGAGLVTILAPGESAGIYRADMAGVIVSEIGDHGAIGQWFADKRRNAAVVGPGLGRTTGVCEIVAAVLSQRRATVVDADGLSCFAGKPDYLAELIVGDCVLTPHEGEFAGLFADDERIAGADRLARTRAAAKRMGAVVLLKGADTVIAAPDGRAVINGDAPPCLAVAGSGDVLSGMVGAALAMGMPPFEAAALAAYAHGQAGWRMRQASADSLAASIRPIWRTNPLPHRRAAHLANAHPTQRGLA